MKGSKTLPPGVEAPLAGKDRVAACTWLLHSIVCACAWETRAQWKLQACDHEVDDSCGVSCLTRRLSTVQFTCPPCQCRWMHPLIPALPQARQVCSCCLQGWRKGWSQGAWMRRCNFNNLGAAHPGMLYRCLDPRGHPLHHPDLQGDPAAGCWPSAPGSGVRAGLGGLLSRHLPGLVLRW